MIEGIQLMFPFIRDFLRVSRQRYFKTEECCLSGDGKEFEVTFVFSNGKVEIKKFVTFNGEETIQGLESKLEEFQKEIKNIDEFLSNMT